MQIMKIKKLRLLGILALCTAIAAGTCSCGSGQEQEAEPVVEETEADEEQEEETGEETEEEVVEEESPVLGETEDAGQEYIDETLFLGDSNTVRYLDYDYVTLNNSIGVVGMGAGSITTLKCAQFSGKSGTYTLPDAVAIMQPKRIIFGYGTNNLMGDVEKYIVSYENGIKAVYEAYPYFDVIINAIPPIAEKCTYDTVSMEAIHEFNEELVKMCRRNGWKFLNSIEALEDETTGYAKEGYTDKDGLHLKEDGVNALFTYIRTHALETEDVRPQPLAAVPDRVEIKQTLIKKDPLTTGSSDADAFIEQNQELLEQYEETVYEEETVYDEEPVEEDVSEEEQIEESTDDSGDYIEGETEEERKKRLEEERKRREAEAAAAAAAEQEAQEAQETSDDTGSTDTSDTGSSESTPAADPQPTPDPEPAAESEPAAEPDPEPASAPESEAASEAEE